MQSEIAVSQKRNTAMVCKFYENKSQRLWFYALHLHYHHFKPYTFDIFLIFFSLSKMKQHCFEIIKPSKPTNELTHNKPLNRTAVVIFYKNVPLVHLLNDKARAFTSFSRFAERNIHFCEDVFSKS